MKQRISFRLREYSPRDLLIVGLPLLVLVFAGFWLASRFIQPAPPDTLVLATGGEGGAYQSIGAAYKDVLGRFGIRVVERPSAGSTENLEWLRNPEQAVDAGFVQSGSASVQEGDTLLSLGSLYNEPLWIFYREELAGENGDLDRIAQLKGRRVAIGGAGSGARHLAQELLDANQIDASNTKLIEQGDLSLVRAFAARKVDAAFVVGPPQSAVVWTLLHTPGIKLMSLAHAEAYTRRFPYLSSLVLPRGAINMAADFPPRNVRLVAATATLVVREDIHPALIGILMQAMSEVHSEPGIFQRPGEFPRATSADFPLAPEAARFYKSGKPWLQRYLPFWAATLIDRMVVLLIPLIAVLIPVTRFAPGLYNWRVKSRIYRRYGELKFIEAEVEADPGKLTRAEWLERVDAIERDVNHMSIPLAFSDMIYTLRFHIGLVRKVIEKSTTDA
ncbi:MAG: ABC transporter substrate-binding protein [Gammaproteobacteria bacterium]|nr:C4-dicarboxylate ABC transporter substrate-binding protein [Rhodocyclaceae bacterium]MBU3910539.1 ABC transporter substrate-binding protein [Gammaproteobacteria bacterium]MBU3989077.1 ABC transporter substrate-binding protein [Gammaproteobacteria bacterium]MBU4005020.1 ABC transporter substrate-binding protein [Gammaproteobacteria bacterium]MBU4020613.1 ABC transporter substrate-binding protein [Gammaproteobacteria bacterium]